ncbi:MAG: tryptophan--tRNA ligase, partial [Rhodospirillales bacterium]
MKRIFSGMQPTGNLHLGNYLGAVRNWVALQHDYECFFCIVDMHAITVPQDPEELRRATREVTAAYIASGVDPKRCAIYHQSALGGYHAELSWILGTITPLG